MLEGRRIVLGVTGGIAAYKAIELSRRLVLAGAHVTPVMTEAAMNMVGPTTMTALGSEAVKTSLWDDSHPIPHTHLGQSADLVVVCPATARILSDYRTGRSADLLSATLIATEAPVVVCPAMHTEMWNHPAVQDNLEVLLGRGVVVVPPEEGPLAGGDIGAGRLAAPESIFNVIVQTLGAVSGTNATGVIAGSLAGRKVLVTAGGTREAIDPVRFIGNKSSGKQGHALADAAAARGAEVTLVTTVARPSNPAVEQVAVATASEMLGAVTSRADASDVIIMAAAVADFRPKTTAERKLKKADGVPSIELERTEDILATLGARRRAGQVIVGFAAETNDVLANAAAKLSRKGADLLVANNVALPEVGFAHDTNAVTILDADGGSVDVPLTTKATVAEVVLDAVEKRLPPIES